MGRQLSTAAVTVGSPLGPVASSNPGPAAAMTIDDRIALCQLVEKSSDADLLREMIGFAAERLMERRDDCQPIV